MTYQFLDLKLKLKRRGALSIKRSIYTIRLYVKGTQTLDGMYCDRDNFLNFKLK